MRSNARTLLSSTLFAWTLTATVAAAQQVDVGASFYVSIGDYYGVPAPSVAYVGGYVPVYEVPVVYHIARHAHVEPAVVLDLRRAGRSWSDITLHYGLSPEIYYVPLEIDPGPPYGRAYGYYKKHPRARWSTIRLADADVVNLVNLRFLSEHHHVAPTRIVELRGSGKQFAAIGHELGAGKSRHHARGSAGAHVGRAKGSTGHGKVKDDGHHGKEHGKEHGKTEGKGKGSGKGRGKGKPHR